MPGRSGTKGSKANGRGGRKKKSNKALMRDLRGRAVVETAGIDLRNIRPEDALQEVLNRAYAMMRFYENEVDNLTENEVWRDSAMGPMPHESIRAARDARAEVAYLAGRALDIGIETKHLELAERAADVLTIFIESVMEEVGLNQAQKRKLGPAIRSALPVLEGTARDKDPATAALPAGRAAA